LLAVVGVEKAVFKDMRMLLVREGGGKVRFDKGERSSNASYYLRNPCLAGNA